MYFKGDLQGAKHLARRLTVFLLCIRVVRVLELLVYSNSVIRHNESVRFYQR
jgi:hypothetical protein